MHVSRKLIVVFFFLVYGMMLYFAFTGAGAESIYTHMESEPNSVEEDPLQTCMEEDLGVREEHLLEVQGELEEMAIDLIDIHIGTGLVSK